jgi:hypothetical protein
MVMASRECHVGPPAEALARAEAAYAQVMESVHACALA